MPEEKLLTIREVAPILGISEKEVIDLSESGALPTYKIAGIYLRFKRQEVEEFKKKFHPVTHKAKLAGRGSLKDKISDFFYFNNFYILAVLLIIILFFIILQKY